MDSTQMLQGEHIVSQLLGGKLTVTNYRIRYSNKAGGHLTSILPSKVSSLEASTRSNPWYLYLAVAAAVGGYFLGEGESTLFFTGLGIGVLLAIVYFLTRRQVFVITPDGGSKIRFETSEMQWAQVVEFVNRTEEATRTKSLP